MTFVLILLAFGCLLLSCVSTVMAVICHVRLRRVRALIEQERASLRQERATLESERLELQRLQADTQTTVDRVTAMQQTYYEKLRAIDEQTAEPTQILPKRPQPNVIVFSTDPWRPN